MRNIAYLFPSSVLPNGFEDEEFNPSNQPFLMNSPFTLLGHVATPNLRFEGYPCFSGMATTKERVNVASGTSQRRTSEEAKAAHQSKGFP